MVGRLPKMPPAGYPAFLQYLQSGRVSNFPGIMKEPWRLVRRGSPDPARTSAINPRGKKTCVNRNFAACQPLPLSHDLHAHPLRRALPGRFLRRPPGLRGVPPRGVCLVHQVRSGSHYANGHRAQTLGPARGADGRGSGVAGRTRSRRGSFSSNGRKQDRTVRGRLCTWVGSSCDDFRDRSRPRSSQDSRAPVDPLHPRGPGRPLIPRSTSGSV